MNMRYGNKGRQIASKVEYLSDSGRVHAGFFGHGAEHTVADVFHVLGDIAEVEIVCQRGDDACVVQQLILITIVVGDCV